MQDSPLARVQSRPIAIDLFSGAGGLGLGFEQAGFDIVAAVEYDPVHAATHLYNFPDCEILCRDATKLTTDQVLAAARSGFSRMRPGEEFPERVHAVIGGPPCQGFSAGGKRRQNDERNDLLLEFVRIVEEIRPQTFCLENVAGLLETRFSAVREAAFRRLRAAGYAISGTETALNAIDYGVPQSRKRVIVLGALGDEPPPLPAKSLRRFSVEDALEGLPRLARYAALAQTDEVPLKAADRKRRLDTRGEYARQLAGLDRVPGDMSKPRDWNPNVLTGLKRTAHTDETVERFRSTRPGEVEPKSRLYRLPLDGPARTLRAGTGSERGAHTSPRPIHPTEDRVITVREAARLHGYPDWFRFHVTNWHGHRQVGNSVPPPLARAVGRALLEALRMSPEYLVQVARRGDPALLSLSRSGAHLVVGAILDELPATRSRSVPDLVDTAEKAS